MSAVRRIRHATLDLALHELRAGTGVPLLLLHELGGASAQWAGARFAGAGPVFALDFVGHGNSDWRPGGGYTPELFAADADAALATLGPCRVAGAGLGAYAALLLAGARSDLVPAALLLPGSGLDGGGPEPGDLQPFDVHARVEAYDPLVRACELDVRPPDYATAFAEAARCLWLVEDGQARPPWWQAVAATGAARVVGDRREGFARLVEAADADRG